MVELGARHPHDTAHRAVIVAVEVPTTGSGAGDLAGAGDLSGAAGVSRVVAAGAVGVCGDVGGAGRSHPADPSGPEGRVATVARSGDDEALVAAIGRGADVAMACSVPSEDLLRACSQQGAGLWICAPSQVGHSVERAMAAGIPARRIIVDAGAVADPVVVDSVFGRGDAAPRMSASIGVDPDAESDLRPGAIEAETVAAVHDGVRVLLTSEVLRVRRCADVATLLASVEGATGAGPAGASGVRP